MNERRTAVMTEEDLAQVLLVRSIEESEAQFFPPETLSKAMTDAGDPEDGAAWLLKRAALLSLEAPGPLRQVTRLSRYPGRWLAASCSVAFVAGLGSNYLGSTAYIHVVKNPVVVLILWNLLVCAVLLAGKAASLFSPRRVRGQGSSGERPSAVRLLPSAGFLMAKAAQAVAGRLWLPRQVREVASGTGEEGLPVITKVAGRFWGLWWAAGRELMLARIGVILHVSVTALVLGALLGCYVRGLFLEYTVLWSSTFVRQPETVALMLNAVFGLPSLVLTGALVGPQQVAEVLATAGAPAAPWIHLFALSVVMFVVIPRAGLAVMDSRTAKVLQRRLNVDLEDEYYASRIGEAREVKYRRVREEVESTLGREIAKLSESVAVFTVVRLFDRSIVGKLDDFRKNGGRIVDLEQEITELCRSFEEELKTFVEAEQAGFEQSLSVALHRAVGKRPSAGAALFDRTVAVDTGRSKEFLGRQVAQDVTDIISVSVSAAVAAAVGTISGGFGAKIGIAILTGLLGTSGPVGFLVGALATLLAFGSVTWLARDTISEAVSDTVKTKRIPKLLSGTMLRDRKFEKIIEQGRAEIRRSVKSQVVEELTPLVPKIADGVLEQIVLRR
jgi:hypothetical protein